MINSGAHFNGTLDALFDLEGFSQSEIFDLTQNPNLAKSKLQFPKTEKPEANFEDMEDFFEFLNNGCEFKPNSNAIPSRDLSKADTKKTSKGVPDYIRVEDFDFDGVSSLIVGGQSGHSKHQDTNGVRINKPTLHLMNPENQSRPSIKAPALQMSSDKNARMNRFFPNATGSVKVPDKQRKQQLTQAEKVADIVAQSKKVKILNKKSEFFSHQSKSLFEFFPKKELNHHNQDSNNASIRVRDQNEQSFGQNSIRIVNRSSNENNQNDTLSRFIPEPPVIPIEITNAKPLFPPSNFGKVPHPFFDYTFPQNHWYYISSSNFRSYQFQITQTALLFNTLVCLPTGLGKTYIASNVIYNYYKWFPTGKIFFLAPTKPLATQQLDSLSMIKDVNMDEVANLDGTLDQKQRCFHYNNCRVFFMTPQTLEIDLQKKRLDPINIVLIIFG
jgi:hypothetical protein